MATREDHDDKEKREEKTRRMVVRRDAEGVWASMRACVTRT